MTAYHSHRPMPDTLDSPLPLRPNDLYLILAFFSIGYYVVERIIHTLFRHLFPAPYRELRAHGKAVPFFGLSMGLLITLFTTPYCYQAYVGLPVRTYVDFSHPGVGEVCVGARSILWIEELSRLGDNPAYLLHHAVSLFAVVTVTWFDLPAVRYLSGIILSLVSELGTNVTTMLAFCGLKASNHRWIWWLECINVATVVVIRLPAVYLLLFKPWHEGLSWVQQAVWIAPTLFYIAYQVYITHARIRRLRVAAKSAREATLAKAR